MNKTWAALWIGVSLSMSAQAQPNAQLDLSNPEDALKATRKIHCALSDGTPTILHWTGKVYAQRTGEPNRHLFNTDGFSIRNCKTYQDETRGYGFRVIARELILFLDPDTNEVLREWQNPWSKETVEVVHTANDPMSVPFPFYAKAKDGTPYKFEGEVMEEITGLTLEKNLFYENPMGGAFQDYVGGHYQAYEVFQFFMPTDELLSTQNDEVMTLTMSNMRVGPWMPWMKMGSRTGRLMFHGSGRKLARFDDLPDRLKQEVRTNHPLFAEPPALDDFRPMANSWVGFKRRVEAQRTAENQTHTLDQTLALIDDWLEDGMYNTSAQVDAEEAANLPDDQRHRLMYQLFKRVEIEGIDGVTYFQQGSSDGTVDTTFRAGILQFFIDEKAGAVRQRELNFKDVAAFVDAYKDPSKIAAITENDYMFDAGCDFYLNVNEAGTEILGPMPEGTCRLPKEQFGQELIAVDEVVIKPGEFWFLGTYVDTQGNVMWGNETGELNKLRLSKSLDDLD